MTPPEPPPAEDGGDAERSRGRASWQKVVGIVGLAVVVVLVILLATGDHGPSRHAPGDSQEHPANIESAVGHAPSAWDH